MTAFDEAFAIANETQTEVLVLEFGSRLVLHQGIMPDCFLNCNIVARFMPAKAADVQYGKPVEDRQPEDFNYGVTAVFIRNEEQQGLHMPVESFTLKNVLAAIGDIKRRLEPSDKMLDYYIKGEILPQMWQEVKVEGSPSNNPISKTGRLRFLKEWPKEVAKLEKEKSS